MKVLYHVSSLTSVFYPRTVCMVFTDIVGFSRISMHINPTVLMDMLSNLFSRFDELCDVHGVLKLE